MCMRYAKVVKIVYMPCSKKIKITPSQGRAMTTSNTGLEPATKSHSYQSHDGDTCYQFYIPLALGEPRATIAPIAPGNLLSCLILLYNAYLF